MRPAGTRKAGSPGFGRSWFGAWAEAAGITLIGRARGEAFDLYTHPQRMKG